METRERRQFQSNIADQNNVEINDGICKTHLNVPRVQTKPIAAQHPQRTAAKGILEANLAKDWDVQLNWSAHFEKLKREYKGKYSIRLIGGWRIIFEIVPGSPKNTIHVIDVVDYH